MYTSPKLRNHVFLKFNGRCAYSGTILESDWQVDHLVPLHRSPGLDPITALHLHDLPNLMPCQRLINHFKANHSLSAFRTYQLGQLHILLDLFPEYPTSDRALKRKVYCTRIAQYFGITASKPFPGVFYFETILE